MNIKSIFITKEVKNKTELTSAIKKLKKEKNAVILAHYYQDDTFYIHAIKLVSFKVRILCS